MPQLATPYYLIDERRLLRNLEIVRQVRADAGVKCVLALKCFATWSLFDRMRPVLDGTTASSPFEARLGAETFGGETHVYSVGFSSQDIADIAPLADTVIFNSLGQFQRLHAGLPAATRLGMRVNPGFSHSHYDLADPARPQSRLGIVDPAELDGILTRASGLMFHFNCENDDFAAFDAALGIIGDRYGSWLARLDWVSLGGGLAFTADGYPLDRFCAALKTFGTEFGVQVYLEPGEAVITRCGELVTTVLDIVQHGIAIAIVDASVEAHLPDHLIYRTQPAIAVPPPGGHRFQIAGRTCLAGDILGEYGLAEPLRVGDEVRIADAAGYTMVKKNWFNGVAMPAIAVQRADGRLEVVRTFGYEDFKQSLS